MLHRKATRALWTAAAIASWLVAVVLAIFHRDDSVRSLAQAVAVTLTVVGALLWAGAHESRRAIGISSVRGLTYVSSNASLDHGPITVEIPRYRPRTAPAPAMAMLGRREPPGRHSQDYFDVFADVTATIFEARDDDPPLGL